MHPQRKGLSKGLDQQPLALEIPIRHLVLLIALTLSTAYAAEPVSNDVFVAAEKSIASNPRSARIVFEASDSDLDALTFTIVTGPSNGTLGSVSGSAVDYTPSNDFLGVDSFTYKASDGSTDSAEKTVTINVYEDLRARPQGPRLPDTAGQNDRGYSVAISSDGLVAALGGPESNASGVERGIVAFFSYANDEWTSLGNTLVGSASFDNFGESVALSADGSIAAISAPFGGDTGEVRVYEQINGTWTLKGSPMDGQLGALSGRGRATALSSDGLIVAVGESDYQDPPPPGQQNFNGRVRMYRFDGSDWAPLGDPLVGPQGGYAGRTVALSSDGLTLAMGTSFEGPGGDRLFGAQVFQYDGTTWSQLGGFVDADTEESPFSLSVFSVALASDGTTLALGLNERGGDISRGTVQVYRFSGSDWTQVGDTVEGVNGDTFGLSVDLSANGNILAIGAPGARATTPDRPGSVRVLSFDGSDWTSLVDTIEGERDFGFFGQSVALSGDGLTLLAGDRFFNVRGFDLRSNDSPVASDVFAATRKVLSGPAEPALVTLSGIDLDVLNYSIVTEPSHGNLEMLSASQFSYTPETDFSGIDTFTYRVSDGPIQSNSATATITVFDSDAFRQLGADIDGDEGGENSGSAVALSGDGRTVAIGAPDNDEAGNRAGKLRVFRYHNGGWSPLGDDVSGLSAGDRLGTSVALSADGNTLAVGAMQTTPGVGADEDGYVQVYSLQDSLWTPLGQSITGLSSRFTSGNAIDLSADGRFLAVGTSNYDPPGEEDENGRVRVFSFEEGRWQQLGPSILGRDNHEFGDAVALSRDGLTVAALAAGVGTENISNAFERGYAAVYRFDGSDWVQRGSDIARPDVSTRRAGFALSADGNTLAFGSPDWVGSSAGTPDKAGRVDVYTFNGEFFESKGQFLEGRAEWSLFGASLSISADGQTLAVGGPHGPRIDADAGHARVYRFENDAWAQLGVDIEGEQNKDLAGTSIGLSDDGRTVAIGAPSNAMNIFTTPVLRAGHVRVYTLTNNAPSIGGRTPADVLQGMFYSTDISAEDLDEQDTLSFSVNSPPSWTDFDASTGNLTGLPDASDVGTTENVLISVEDSMGAEATLAPFSVTVLPDGDEDGIGDEADNCPEEPNADQGDLNSDGEGDACDPDIDGDGASNALDAFPTDPSETLDSDGDGLGNNREGELGTDPQLADSDGDGFEDGEEIDSETDPLSADDVPTASGLNIILIKAAIDAGA